MIPWVKTVNYGKDNSNLGSFWCWKPHVSAWNESLLLGPDMLPRPCPGSSIPAVSSLYGMSKWTKFLSCASAVLDILAGTPFFSHQEWAHTGAFLRQVYPAVTARAQAMEGSLKLMSSSVQPRPLLFQPEGSHKHTQGRHIWHICPQPS